MKIKYRRYYIYYLAKVSFSLVRFLPRKVLLSIASFAGGIAFMVLGKYRNITISNLNSVFGNRPENTRIAKDVFRNLLKTGVEWLAFLSMDKPGIARLITEPIGLEHVEKATQDGNGIVLITAHLGNWELVSFYLTAMGFKGGPVVRKIYFYKYDKFIADMRNRFGAEVLYRDDSPKKILKLLKRGEVLGILADQDVDSVEGVFVDFFGRPTFTPTGPVKLAMASGASLIPAFMIRKPDNSYKFVVEEPIPLVRSEDKEADVKKYTQMWTSVLEKHVREHPDQWVWVHKRWKTQEEKTI